MFARFVKFFYCFFVFLAICSCIPAFSQSAAENKNVYGRIDSAFEQASPDELSKILAEYSASKSYATYESYALKKVRLLVIQNQLDLASQMDLAIIDNNLENYEAVDLYSYIDRAMTQEKNRLAAEEAQRKAEEERRRQLAEKAKAQVENRNNYQAVSTADGKSVYISADQQSFSQFLWTASLGIADFMFQKASEPDYSSLKYGLSGGFKAFHVTDDFVLGGELYAGGQFLTMGKGENEILASARLVPELAFANFNKNLFLRLGFASAILASGKREETGSVKTFLTPAVGLGFDNILLGKSTFAFHADYYPGHLAYKDVNFAMEGGASVLIPLSMNDKIKIGIELGVSDMLFIKDSGIDNRAKGSLGIGVGNVYK